MAYSYTAHPVCGTKLALIRPIHARTIVEHNINRLPVTEEGRLTGIISRVISSGCSCNPTIAIAERLRSDFRTVDGLAVSVEDGVVSLSGTVESRALAQTAARIAENRDGVVAVNSDPLAWKTESRSEPQLPVGPA